MSCEDMAYGPSDGNRKYTVRPLPLDQQAAYDTAYRLGGGEAAARRSRRCCLRSWRRGLSPQSDCQIVKVRWLWWSMPGVGFTDGFDRLDETNGLWATE